MFNDESTFTRDHDAANNYVRRRHEDEYRHIVSHQPSIMVGGRMAANCIGKLELVFGMMSGTKYIDVLERKMLPTARSLHSDDNWILHDDNAPDHRAKIVQHWCKSLKLKEWISLSNLQI